MKNFLPVILLLFALQLTAQIHTKENLIQVTGIAKSTATPDIGILYIRLSHIDSNMSKAMDGLTKNTEYYTSLLVKLQFKKEEIKTTGFSVTANKVYRRDAMIDSGFIANQSIKLEFKNDKENLSKILHKLSSSETNTDFSFGFKISDSIKSQIESQLIQIAIKDATYKANVIASSTGRKIISLKNVQYGNNSNISPEIIMQRDFKSASAAELNFTPEDQQFQESVIMNWAFE